MAAGVIMSLLKVKFLSRQLTALLLVLVVIVILTIVLVYYLNGPEEYAYWPHSGTLLGSRTRTAEPGVPLKAPDQQELQQMVSRAVFFMRRSDLVAAAGQLSTVLVFDPDNTQALAMMGNICYTQGKYPEAESYFRRLVKLEPRNPAALNNLGQALARQGKYEEAVRELNLALRGDPESPVIALNLAGTYALLKDKEKALSFFRMASWTLGERAVTVAEDSCFDSIRNEPEFQRLLAELRGRKQNDNTTWTLDALMENTSAPVREMPEPDDDNDGAGVEPAPATGEGPSGQTAEQPEDSDEPDSDPAR